MTLRADGFDLRADLFLTFARAFEPPVSGAVQRAFVEDLPEDIALMAAGIGLRLDAEAEAFAAACADLDEPQALLPLYAGLFLTPPAPVHLETAVYLDGALMGGSEFEMAQWYARHGLGHAGNRRLADGVSVNLDFAGELFRRALARTVTERGLNLAYARLADCLVAVVEPELLTEASRSATEAVERHPATPARPIGTNTAEDLCEIAVRLEAYGLAFDHIRARAEWSEQVYAARRAAGLDDDLDGRRAAQPQMA
jgi:TorA maturation chaperone TorD